jgi:hypothetical protein
MGLFGDIFGFAPEHGRVRSYFDGRRSNYEALRQCIYDMIQCPLKEGRRLDQTYLDNIKDEVFIHFRSNEHLVMRDYFTIATMRCISTTKDVTLARPAVGHFIGNAVISETPGSSPHKSSERLRCDLITNDQFGWAWVSLYDDGTRMRPSIDMLEGNGWRIGLNG